jgi:hypothetical protein
MSKRKSAASAVAVKTAPRRRARPITPLTAKSPIAAGASPPPIIYAVHPAVAMIEKWIRDLPVKTGRTLDQWIEHIHAAGPPTERECRAWLRTAYQMGTNTAAWLADKVFAGSRGPTDDTPEGYLALAPIYVEEMYAGGKAALRPIHDHLIRIAQSLGDEVRICPCKAIVPLYRRNVFAKIRPASSRRIELGLALEEEPFTKRLRDTGGLAKGDRITHTVALTSLADIDLQVKRWLKQAYERDAKAVRKPGAMTRR